MKKTVFLLLLNLCLVSSYAQKKTFIINKSLNDVINLYERSYTNDLEEIDAVQEVSDHEADYFTFIKIANEDYLNGSDNHYLILKNTGVSSEVKLMNSEWNIEFNKITENKTACIITLQKIIPHKNSKASIIVNESISSGVLEQEITDFLENNDAIEITEFVVASVEGSYDNAVSAVEAVTAADYDEDLIVVDSAVSFYSDIDFANFTKMLSAKKLIALPNTLDFFIKNIGETPTIIENETCKNDEYYNWIFSNDVNLIYFILKDSNQTYSISYFGEEKITGLPLGLTFNQTTFDACKKKFAANGAKSYQETEDDSEGDSARAFLVMEFKYEKYFVTLGFYNNDYLTSIKVSTVK